MNETLKALIQAGAGAEVIAAVLAANTAAPAPAAPAPAAPAPAAPAPAAVPPTWVHAIRKIGANTSAAKEAKKAAKYLKEQVLEGTFGEFSRDEAGKERVMKGFFESCLLQGLWNKVRDGESISMLGKSKAKREKAHDDAKAVYYAYQRILAMFRPVPVKKAGITLEAVLAALESARGDYIPKIKAEKWEGFISAVEAALTETE